MMKVEGDTSLFFVHAPCSGVHDHLRMDDKNEGDMLVMLMLLLVMMMVMMMMMMMMMLMLMIQAPLPLLLPLLLSLMQTTRMTAH